MTYGARLYTEAGQLAYTTDYPVYQFLGTFQFNSYITEYHIESTHAPLIFVKPYNNASTTEVVVCAINYTFGIWSIRANTSAQYTLLLANNSTGYYPGQSAGSTGVSTIEALVFIRPRNQDAETGYGMNVYDSSGNLTFTSKMKPLKVSAWHDTTAQSIGTYQNAEPVYSSETLTGGTIPTNWAAYVPSLGTTRRSTVAPAYYNFNGNQGSSWESIGAGRGSNSTTVNFNEAKYNGGVPPGVGGQYPSAVKYGGRRLLFIDHSSYATPYYDHTNWAPIFTSSYITVPYNGSNIKQTLYSYNGALQATSLVKYTNPDVGTATVSGTSVLYTPPSNYTQSNTPTVDVRGYSSNGNPSNNITFGFSIGMPDINITDSATLPSGSVGNSYYYALNGTGARPPYTYWAQNNVPGGYSWPPGLSLDSSGVISGIPTAAGTYQVLIEIRDTFDGTYNYLGLSTYYNSKVFTITIN